MGNCNSSDSTRVATAKLILQDGKLQEFSYPVKVSFLLQKYPACFICNSDEMDFDDVVSAIDEDQLLQPGQLYFALPLSRLKQRLQPHEMAALAVKASSALMKTADKCGSRRKQILLSNEYDSNPKRVSPTLAAGAGTVHRRGRATAPAGKGRFAALLSSIPE
ncbi:hypothetical protein LR48_Vigan06g038700 [Vigna angularis]|uniref:Uncharacterized protein n=2 Tax=Phaseolus angularis TaxID=3914 RepID=A0A0L9UQV3_PHAAN|nr:uncharacterized protein LOC108335427 [Vigna angularis]KOM45081.1 hypothetical protein LR48_Vigan06g038700 [Vigna angularis]BAU00152.1 hypothetical protein VIGAN_10171900 [Vigna angularis var. angularis]